MVSMYGPDAAADVMKRVGDQIVVTSLRRVAREFELYSQHRGDLLACPRIFNAIKALEYLDLDDEAAFILLQALVHTALHFVCAARDVATACPTAIALMHRAERADEPAQIADLRLRGIQLVKSCSRKGLRHGRKAMVLNAVRYEQECPIGHVVTELRNYAQGISDSLGRLWFDAAPSGTTRTERPEGMARSGRARAEAIGRNLRMRNFGASGRFSKSHSEFSVDGSDYVESNPDTVDRHKRTRKRDDDSIATEEYLPSGVKQGKKRLRRDLEDSDSQTVGIAANSRRPRDRRQARNGASELVQVADEEDGVEEEGGESDEEVGRRSNQRKQNGNIDACDVVMHEKSDHESDSTARPTEPRRSAVKQTRRRGAALEWESPRGTAEDDGDETEELQGSARKALRNLDGAADALRRDRGEDPLDEVVKQSRTANPGMGRRKNLYQVDANAREATPIEDDVSSSDNESGRRPKPSRTFPAELSLDEDSADEDPRKMRKAARLKKNGTFGVIKRGAFTKEEDALLIEGLKKYGWSEWQRIATNCWKNLPYKRGKESVKDRARYLQRQARINPDDYPPPFGYKRPGPPSVVPATLRTTPVRKSLRNVAAAVVDEDIDEDLEDDDEDANNARNTQRTKRDADVDEDLDEDEDAQDPESIAEANGPEANGNVTVIKTEDITIEEVQSSPERPRLRSSTRKQARAFATPEKVVRGAQSGASGGEVGNRTPGTEEESEMVTTPGSEQRALRRSTRRRQAAPSSGSSRKRRNKSRS